MNANNPEKKEGTVLFCDIRNFTSLFDEKDPFEAVEFANTVLAVLGEVVEESGGTVDRFTGDGFLAHFGFSETADHHAALAADACILIRKKLNEINANRYFKVESVVSVGIGINSGVAAYCKLETNQLKQTTVLGDMVNTAARIEEMTKYFMVDILFSESTFQQINDNYLFQKLPLKSIRGKKEPVQTYWFLPTNT
ncbi:adenylate/guanylate cyclase domain-containing protein [Gracilimonas tropica]|uniref:adenylate/guanylate cyclase domain-containing protein n=1 Tax=Gracilimonas tropica TaxID=454600 RepID=UPI00037FADCC|nr:adenylate/guanylate cyclase domain-containing protein [Gracilimonas tropica]